MIPRLMQLATGIDFWDITAKQAMGEKAFDFLPDELVYNQNATIVFALPVTSGTFKTFGNIESAKALNGIDRIDSLKPIGYEFDGVLESSKRACSVIAFGENAEITIENAMKGLDEIDLEIDSGDIKTKILPEKGQL